VITGLVALEVGLASGAGHEREALLTTV